jgi:hypothetical protein
MGRTRGAVVAVLASLLVLGALTAASASASGPVWAYCGKTVPKNTGAYTDKACSIESPSHEGKWELIDGIGKGKGFKGTGESVEFRQVNEKYTFEIFCEKDKVSGRVLAPDNVAGVVISMSHCRTSPFDAEKGCAVSTVPLSGHLGWIDQAKGEAGLELTNEAEPETGIFANIQGCFFPHGDLRISGAVIAKWGPTGVVTKETTLSTFFGSTPHKYAEKASCDNVENIPASFEGEEASHLLTGEMVGLGPVACEGAALWVPPSFPFHIKGEALMVH